MPRKQRGILRGRFPQLKRSFSGYTHPCTCLQFPNWRIQLRPDRTFPLGFPRFCCRGKMSSSRKLCRSENLLCYFYDGQRYIRITKLPHGAALHLNCLRGSSLAVRFPFNRVKIHPRSIKLGLSRGQNAQIFWKPNHLRFSHFRWWLKAEFTVRVNTTVARQIFYGTAFIIYKVVLQMCSLCNNSSRVF